MNTLTLGSLQYPMHLSCSLIWEGPIETHDAYSFNEKGYLQKYLKSFQDLLQQWGSTISFTDEMIYYPRYNESHPNENHIDFDNFNYENVSYLFTFQRIPESLNEYPTSWFTGSMELQFPTLNVLAKICSIEEFLESKALKIFDNGVVTTLEDVSQLQAEFERLASIDRYTFETRSQWKKEFIEEVYDEEEFERLEQMVLQGTLSQDKFNQQVLEHLRGSCSLNTEYPR